MRPALLRRAVAASMLAACAESSNVIAPESQRSAIAEDIASWVGPVPAEGDEILHHDNFDGYPNTSALRGVYARAGAMSMVTGRNGSGRAVRFSYAPGQTYNLLERTIPASADVHVSYWYRTSPGADPSNDGANRWGMTVLRAEREREGRWLVSTAQSSLPFGVDDNSVSMPTVYQNISSSPRFGTTNDGTWHRLTARLVGGAAGYAIIWVDGTLVTDTRGMGYRHAGGGVSMLRFPGELAADPATPFSIDIDDVVVWRSTAATPPTDTSTVPPTDTTTPPADTTTPPSAPSPAPVARISVSPATVSLNPGGSTQLTVALHDSAGNILTDRAVTWSSNDTEVATVSTSGLVRAVAAGSAVVTATSEGRSATAQVTVAPVPVSTVSVTLNSSSVQAGNSTQAVATLRDADGNALSGRAVSWQSSNSSVATVNTSGLVSAIGAGTVNVIATSEGKSGQATLTVTAPPAPVAVVTVSPSSVALDVGGTAQLSASLRDASGTLLTGRTITWSSNNPAVATVTSAGRVSGVAAGDAVISATSEGRSGSSVVTVNTPAPAPPTGAGEPVYDSGRDYLLVRDDFNYSSRSAMLNAYPVGRGTENVELTTGRGGSGGAARLKYGIGGAYDIIFGTETRLDRVGGWNGSLPQKAGPYTHLYFTTWFRTTAGADPAENDGSGIKGFMFWHSGGGRYQNAVNKLGHPDDRTRGPKGANPDNATTGLNLYKTADGRAPLWSTYADGQWHRFTVEIYAGNDPTGLRGERYWIDGQLIYDDVGLPVGSGTRAGHYDYQSPITHWMVFGNFVSEGARSSFFNFDVDDWVAWTAR